MIGHELADVRRGLESGRLDATAQLAREGSDNWLSARDISSAAITRDKDGNVIAGSLTDAIGTKDIWTFTRDIRSADPNWKLSETDEA